MAVERITRFDLTVQPPISPQLDQTRKHRLPTHWRWLAAGEYDPGTRSCWRTTPATVEALYLAGGRPTAAWRLLSEEGVEVPSLPTFCRAVRRDVSLAERAYARHGEDGRRRYSVYRRWEPKARNDVWETDHDELEIKVVPLRGRRLVRPWLMVIEDGFSRLVMGWALPLYPTTAEVLVAIRQGIVIDPDRGAWGGVPQLIRFDGGREFLAHSVTRAAGELGCAALPTAPCSPHLKGKVERLHRTIGEGLSATLPHYTGGPRRANGKLYAQPPLSLPQLQTLVREFVDAYNTGHRHSSLGGMTPAEKWASSAAPLDLVESERLRRMLMVDQTRKVDNDGIHFENAIFIAPEIAKLGRGVTVEVRYLPYDLRSIEVFTEDGWLCTAYQQDELTREQSDAVVQARHEAAREMGRHKAAASRKARSRIAPLTAGGYVQDFTGESAQQDAEKGELLKILGLAEQLNKPIPPSAQESAEA